MFTRKVLIAIIIFFVVSKGLSQSLSMELLTSSGGHLENQFYRLDFTLGELDTDIHNPGNFILSEGFNQGEYNITSISNFKNTGIEFRAFPNPVSDYLQLTLNSNEYADFVYIIIDQPGTILEMKKINSLRTSIPFGNYPPGAYIINISKKNILVDSFVIIKN
ncbi:MAG: T9SS type A sorting domain-containing protein [Bacteroidales bacterium]